MKTPLFIQNIPIHDIATDGRGVGRHEGRVVFVEGAVPGDVVNVQVRKKKSAFMDAVVTEIVSLSPDRVQPVCEHFGTCGGCKWQHLSYKAQLTFKERFVKEAVERIGKVIPVEFLPILGSADTYYYRNKLEYTFSAKRWLTNEELQSESVADRRALGYHIPGMFDRVLDIRNCYLQPDPSNDIRNAVKQYALANDLTFYDIRKKEGFLRTLMIRNTIAGEVMVLVAVFEWQEEALMKLLTFIKERFPQVTSLLYTYNPKGNDTLADLEIKCFHGRDHITEEMEGLQFKISARSFFQTNPKQAYGLYKIARGFAGLDGTETVYDLYTGTGSIANFVACQCKKVIGVEYVEDAVVDARANSAVNGITNTRFFSGDLKDLLTAPFFDAEGKPDVIITDPPRAGMHENVVRAILEAAPGKIVYVSCNPGTQARDIQLLSEKYSVAKLQAVDMFPQTAHVESVALLVLRSES